MVLLWVHPDLIFECAAEMRHIVKAGACTRIFHRITVLQQLLGTHQAAIDDVLVRAHAGHLLKDLAQVKLVHEELS